MESRRRRASGKLHWSAPSGFVHSLAAYPLARTPETIDAQGVDQVAVRALLAAQDGVIARRQVLGSGGADHDIERLLFRREWARVFEGVDVAHTGRLAWRQRAWAAVLVHSPAALGGESALVMAGLRTGRSRARLEPDVIDVVVPACRRVVDPPGVRTTRIRDYDAHALANLGPPRVRIEHAALTVASRATSDDAVVAMLGDAAQTGGTTAARLLEHLRDRPRLTNRRLIVEVLGDVASGAHSALERRYLRDVERAHGLPVVMRQRRVVAGGVSAFRDVDYPAYRTVVELDGRLGHDGTQDRWDDLDRDLTSAIGGSMTLRVGWRQVLEPCRLADSVARILRARGWPGSVPVCGEACRLDSRRSGER